jgi:hypothetical protein
LFLAKLLVSLRALIKGVIAGASEYKYSVHSSIRMDEKVL